MFSGSVKRLVITIALVSQLFSIHVNASLADKINAVATNALNAENYSKADDKILLYGVRTNGPDTAGGRLACAKVATIALRKAGAIDKIYLGVRHVEAELSHWQKIHKKSELKPGDVIVWVNRFNGREDKRCTGYGNCHVGIVTKKGYFHNSPITDAPTYGGVSLLGFYFKVGFRAPD